MLNFFFLQRQLSESSSNFSDSDSDSEPIMNSKKGPRALESDCESNSTESEWQSDWSSDNSEVLLQKVLLNDIKDNEEASKENTSSSSDDENSEKCPICLLKLSKQEVATPESCAHTFCFECLQEWSKNVSTCPIDRKEFTVMLVRKRYLSTHKREVKVTKVEKSVEEEVIDDTTFCELCHQSDREDIMLLCDGCDSGYHMDCLTPPLEEVPAGDWFCSACSLLNRTTSRNEPIESRLIPRTMHSERVRHNVETQRRQYTFIDIFDPDQPSTSSGFASNDVIVIKDSPKKALKRTVKKRVTSKRKTVRKKRRKTTRRKYTTEYEICQETGAKIAVRKLVPTKRKSSKRKTKRKIKGKSKKRKATSSSKKHCSSKNSEREPQEVVQSTASTLHLFGRPNELDYFSDDSEDEQPPIVNKPIITKVSTKLVSSLNKPEPKKRVIVPASSSSNFLDSILESQEQWHSKRTPFQMSGGKIIIKNKN